MKWARDIEQYIAREREKFSAAQARRRPDRNVCCKCAYDLAGVAEPPPTPAPPDLKCPECGAPVVKREHWWTDGRHSMKRLLTIAVIASALVLVLGAIALAMHPADDLDTSTVMWYTIVYSAGLMLSQVALFTGAVIITHYGYKGVAITNHIRPRVMTLLTPVIVSTLLLVGGMWLMR